MEKLFIIIPAYNEEETIGQVVEEWYPVIEAHAGNGDSRMVLIDDGSKDNTYMIIKKMQERYPLLIALTKENEGHGATVLYGYHYALKNGADYIFQTDSDGQTRPEEFEEFWNNRTEYDMIIGSRRHREDGWSRRFVTKVLKMVIFVCFRVKVEDANTPFRLMQTGTLQEYIDLIPEKYNLSNVIISVIYAKKERKVKYIPITFRLRQGGVNSINFRKICKIGMRAVKDFRMINKVLSNKNF